MPASGKEKQTAKSKSKSNYTYTGCWTCRRRHVKCGLEKPVCKRCVKAGFECQGYDFRFAGSDSTRSYRRPVASASSASRSPALSNVQVSGMLEELETATTSTQKGPFSVLAFADSPRTVDVVIRSGRGHLASRLDSPRDLELVSLHSSSEAEMLELRSYHSPSPTLILEPHLLKSTPRQSELFEHWTMFLCYNMTPFSTSSANPFRYLYPSLALSGLMSNSGIASARLAVFHGICGTAAWSLSRLKPDNPTYRALSVNHDSMALRYIQDTIEQPGGLSDAAIPAAIMACLTGDIVSGRLDLWGKYLQGGFRCLINLLTRQKVPDATISSLGQQYIIAAALAKFGTVSEIRMLRKGIIGDYRYLEECHCITRPMVETLIAINTLARPSKRRNYMEIKKLRQHLAQSVPRFDNLGKHHISHVYYYAITIYFHRELQVATDTEQLASRAIDHLQWAKDTGQGNPGKILMWPVLIIGAECTTIEQRERLLAWCNSQLSVHVNNMDTFINLLQRTWAFKSPNLSGANSHRLKKVKTEEFDVDEV